MNIFLSQYLLGFLPHERATAALPASSSSSASFSSSSSSSSQRTAAAAAYGTQRS